jgi:hypothetical protein
MVLLLTIDLPDSSTIATKELPPSQTTNPSLKPQIADSSLQVLPGPFLSNPVSNCEQDRSYPRSSDDLVWIYPFIVNVVIRIRVEHPRVLISIQSS